MELENAEALFIDENKRLKWEFEYLAQGVYNANILPVNYANPAQAVRYINHWVSNITHQQINSIVHEGMCLDKLRFYFEDKFLMGGQKLYYKEGIRVIPTWP